MSGVVAATQPASGAAGRAERIESPPRWWDMRHMDLTLTLTDEDIRHRRASGVVTYHIEPRVRASRHSEARTQVEFDAVRPKISRVELSLESDRSNSDMSGWSPVPYELRGDRLRVVLGREPRGAFRVRIQYAVERPRLGLHFVLPDAAHPERPTTVYSMSEPLQARYWLPTCDWPDARWTSDIRIRVAPPLRAVSIGEPVRAPAAAQGDSAPLVTYHWRQDTPVDPHMLGFAVGEFTTLHDSWHGRPVLTYTHPRYAAAARYTFRRVPEILDFYTALTGVDYPWPQFSHVVIPEHFHGGMEHIGFDMLAPTLMSDSDDGDVAAEDAEFNYVAHMLAHQWFGGLVNYARVPEAWVNEGFGTYLHQLWHTRAASYDGDPGGGRQGEDWLAHDMARSAEMVARFDVAGVSRPLVNERLADADQIYNFDAGKIYWKGAWVLHMLRNAVGDEAFRDTLRLYLTRHSNPRREDVGMVDTAAFERAVKDATGRDLSGFFDQWVRRGGTPHVSVELSWDSERHQARITARQTQAITAAAPPFALPMELHFSAGEWNRQEAVVLTDAEQSWDIHLPEAPAVFCVDPRGVLLKSLNENKPAGMWLEQARRGPTALSRSQAVDRLRGEKDPEVTAALRDILADESLFWGTRRRAAAALGESRTDEALGTLLAADNVGIEHPRVRAAVVDALGRFSESSAAQAALVRHAVASERAAVRSTALRRLAACRADPSLRPQVLALLVDAARPNCNQRVRDAALDTLEALNDADALPLLIDAIRPDAADRDATGRFMERTIERIAALASQRSDTYPAVLAFLRGFPDTAHPRVRAAVEKALRSLESARDERDSAA